MSATPTSGLHHILVETHNWGKSVAFWQALGFELVEDHGTSGILRPPPAGQPYLYLAEVAADRTPVLQLVVAAEAEFDPDPPAQASAGWADSHWGTRLLAVTDPDGREVLVQVAPD